VSHHEAASLGDAFEVQLVTQNFDRMAGIEDDRTSLDSVDSRPPLTLEPGSKLGIQNDVIVWYA
jgi:hypothetical protein